MNLLNLTLFLVLSLFLQRIIGKSNDQCSCSSLYTQSTCQAKQGCQWTYNSDVCSQILMKKNIYKGQCQLIEECSISEIENQLIDVVKKLQYSFSPPKKAQNLLLIGNTGSGKSTIFNWISGFTFKVIKDPETKKSLLIPISNDENQTFSAQGNGASSVTKFPQFSFQRDHVIIDFPGFSDTDGWISQLINDLMLLNLVTQNSVKLVYVLDHPIVDFQKRGMDIQNIVLKLFANQEVQPTSIMLILNQYIDEINIDDLIKDVQKQLDDISKNDQFRQSKSVFEAMKKNIFVIPKVTLNKNNLDEVFNNHYKRNELWKNLLNLSPISIELCHSNHFNKASDYILKNGQQLIKLVMKNIQEKQICIENNPNNKEIIKYMFNDLQMLLIKLLQENSDKLLIYYEIFANIYDLQQCYKPFFEIYEYFKQYKKYIKAYELLEDQLQNIQALIQTTSKIFNVYFEREEMRQEYQKNAGKKDKKEQMEWERMMKEQERLFKKLQEELLEKQKAQEKYSQYFGQYIDRLLSFISKMIF